MFRRSTRNQLTLTDAIMQYERLGDTGLIVSRLALGAMTFGEASEGSPLASVYKVDQRGANALVARALDAGVNFFNFARDAGVGIMVWSPLAGGFLSGKYTRENPGGSGGRLTGFDFIPFDREKGYDLVERLRAIGARHGATVAQEALAWLLTRPFVSTVLVGASRIEQLDDNLGAARLRLDPDDVRTIDQLTIPAPIYPGWYNAKIFDAAAREALGG